MNDTKKDGCEVVYDFGEDFGMLTKENISLLSVDLHSSLSTSDSFNKTAVDNSIKEVN